MSIIGKKNQDETSSKKQKKGKGRPTPKRREAQQRNLRPIVVDKKEAKRRKREANNKRWQAQQAALMGRGDERDLPLQDQGPHRKFIRDYVDSRRTLSEYMLPMLLFFIFFSFLGPAFSKDMQSTLFLIPVYTMWGIVIAGLCEVIFYVRKINKILLRRTNGNYSTKGNGRYVLFRITALRRTRRPVPMVKRGEIPFNPSE
ncbi:MAG: DUF3043 domain-containing protein [Actinomycetaceae bacterium]|nr:DUF3043 domain-containing protein [Actinomycetaceae bacterium]